MHRGLIVGGDRFITSAAESQALREALPEALAVDMGAAAVAQVCWDYGTPPCRGAHAVRPRRRRGARGIYTFMRDVARHYSVTCKALKPLAIMRTTDNL